MVIASHNLDCLLKDVRASPPLLRFVKQVTTLGLMEALGSESGSEQLETDGAPLRPWQFIASHDLGCLLKDVSTSPHHPD